MPKRPKEKNLPTKFEPGYLDRLDKRTHLAQRLLALREAIYADIGEMSAVKQSLVDRYVFLNSIADDREFKIITNQVADIEEALGRYTQGVNALKGLANAIGIDTLASSKPWIAAEAKEVQTTDD